MIQNASRYGPGGDLYEKIAQDFGTQWADRAYAASLADEDGTQLRYVLNDARQSARGADPARPGSDSTLGNFWEQVTTDPLAAPLDALNGQISLAVWNVVRNPFVLGAAVLVGYFWLWPKLKKALA